MFIKMNVRCLHTFVDIVNICRFDSKRLTWTLNKHLHALSIKRNAVLRRIIDSSISFHCFAFDVVWSVCQKLKDASQILVLLESSHDQKKAAHSIHASNRSFTSFLGQSLFTCFANKTTISISCGRRYVFCIWCTNWLIWFILCFILQHTKCYLFSGKAKWLQQSEVKWSKGLWRWRWLLSCSSFPFTSKIIYCRDMFVHFETILTYSLPWIQRSSPSPPPYLSAARTQHLCFSSRLFVEINNYIFFPSVFPIDATLHVNDFVCFISCIAIAFVCMCRDRGNTWTGLHGSQENSFRPRG